jgi:hypothetical protein
MAACEEQGFTGVTSGHFATFAEKAASLGMPGLQGHSGQASRSGVTIRWEFNAAEKTLTVQCTEAPMLLPCALINAKIRDAVTAVLRDTGMGDEAPAQA